MSSWQPGSRIESYEVLDVLGHGGMGKVFRVRHVITNRVEALKVISSALGSGEESLERFNREIRLLATLSHPNIAGLHNAFRFQDQLVMVMECVPGANLGLRLKTGITLDQSLNYVRQILRALEYAHATGITHRDIKPSNIMVTPTDQIKLLDFGLALSDVDTRLTQPGGLVGSMHYVAPELISGQAADARSDLYAVGVTLYEMITGRLPIEGATHAQIIAGHLQHEPVAPSKINSRIPEALSAAVLKALKKDKEQRWPSATAFLQALDDAHLGSAADLLVTTTVQHRTTPTPLAQTSQAPIQPETLKAIAFNLANHVGPIANLLVKRASSHVHDVRELCEEVAKEIESAEARKKFLHSVERWTQAGGSR
jgi:eukaryotic-like serine/threonine-protein kinase